MARARIDARTQVRLVLCNGVFDLLHVAHIRHLKEARSMGDRLVVGLTMDGHTGKPYPCIIPEEERREMLQALGFVSGVSFCRTGVEALEQWKPNIFCKGYDREMSGLQKAEADYCKAHGIEVRYTKENTLHTGQIIRRIKQCEFA